VLLLEDQPVLVIVVEVQLSLDPDKPFIRPTYVVGARGRREGGLPVAIAALVAAAGLETERAMLYEDLVLVSLGEAARMALEELMTIPNDEYQSEFIRKNLQVGREQGHVDATVRLFERRLARPLTKDERDRLAVRLREEGVDRLTDTALDLSPEALVAWLAATNTP